MSAIDEIRKYLSRGRNELPPLPAKLTAFGYESLIVLEQSFYEFLRTQHSIALDAKKDDDPKQLEYERRDKTLESVMREIRGAIPRSKSSALLPICYESLDAIDFSALLCEAPNEAASDIRISVDKRGSIDITIRSCTTKQRGYLRGITRRGIMELAHNEAFRKLWIYLLIRNSYEVRGLKSSFTTEQISVALDYALRHAR